MSAEPDWVFPQTVSDERMENLRLAVAGFDRQQLLWSSGFLAGLAQSTPRPAAQLAEASTPNPDPWFIYYATETGNSARVATQLAERAAASGIAATVHDLREVKPRSLAKVRRAVFVIATHGAGDPPEGTEPFFDLWFSDKASRLEGLQYGVVALGDSSYADFCEVGRRFEARLAELGASAILDRVDCDLDFEEPAGEWSEAFVESVGEQAAAARAPAVSVAATAGVRGRTGPYAATVLSKQKITGRGSSKDVRHVELDLTDSGLRYQPGDAIGVHCENPSELVDVLIRQAGLHPDDVVTHKNADLPLVDVLRSHKEVTRLNRPLLETVAREHPALQSILVSRANLTNYLNTRQLTDLLSEFPRAWEAQEFVDALRALTPRLYSIASSPDANPDEAHLTVAVVRYEKFGRPHWGAASSFLAEADTAPIHVESNDRFRLPADGDVPIVMIGAGTGVAPYRAFVEHRRELGHGGRNWLVFGERNLASDFLYQIEWLRYRKEGTLTRLDVAFSRDQAEKVYVQHRIREQGRELYRWLEDGAHVYVCGDAERMAPDVETALTDVLREHGGLARDRAVEYLAMLRREGRYKRDIY